MARAKAVPDKAPCALLLIDVINDLDFEGGDKLLRRALPMAKKLAALVKRARAAHVPIIYANDNFGRWRSDFRAQVRHCLEKGLPGRPITELLQPSDDDYFVLKPKHSAFFSTALDTLLKELEAQTLILTGMAGDICVLFTAHDAHMRDYRLFVPSDCIASESAKSNAWALRHMARFLRVDTRAGAEVDFSALKRRRRR
jgi:nicotinamidase-related amidase